MIVKSELFPRMFALGSPGASDTPRQNPATCSGRLAIFLLPIALAISLSVWSRAHAEPTMTPPAFDAGLTGNWGGLRSQLANDGIEVRGGYTSEFAYNARGGERQTASEVGELDLGIYFDLWKLADIPGGAFKATITDRRGQDLGSSANLGVLQEVQEINGRGRAWRITQFWYQQAMGALQLKVGRNPPNEDFAAFSCDFQNLSFCSAAPGEMVTDSWFNWPIAAWSVRLRFDLREFYAQAGAYLDNPHDLDPGIALGHFGGTRGVLYPIELGWTPTFAGRTGSYRIGGWLNTATPSNSPVAVDVNGAPIKHASRTGIWINIEQPVELLSIGEGTNASFFFNFTQADPRTAAIDQQIAAGVFVEKFLPGRPRDVIGLGVARTELGGLATGAEYAIETYYHMRPKPWLSVSPNLQFVIDPGGVTTRRSVVVLGIKAGVKF